MMVTVEGEDVWYSMEFALTEGTVSREYMKEFIQSFAAISIKISESPCEAIGSPATNHKGEIVIGNLVSKGYPQFIEGPYYAGPFTNQRDRWTSKIDAALAQIKNAWTRVNGPLIGYLALKHARGLVMAYEPMASEEKAFYFCHADSTGGNVMAKDNKITALIDWEW